MAAIGVLVAISTQRLIEGELGGPAAAEAAVPQAPPAPPYAPASLGPGEYELLALALGASALDENGVAEPARSLPSPAPLPIPRRDLAARGGEALAVPEPGTAPLLGAGLIGLLLLARRR